MIDTATNTVEPTVIAVGNTPDGIAVTPNGKHVLVIHGVSLAARIRPAGTLRYAFHAKATDASLAGTKDPVYVTLIFGDDSGATSVNAAISGTASVTAGISH